MKRFLLVALVATALGTSSGCCRGWFIWPGQYPHNPAFSQCCDPPWGPPDPFGHDHHAKAGWGHGPHGGDGGHGPHGGDGGNGGDCCYNSCGIADWFNHDGGCGCGGGQQGYPQGYPPGGGYPGAYGPGPGPGMYGPGMYGPGMYGPQPAPDAMSAGQVAYPYYTNRGPRDFFLGYPPGSRPPSIGP